MSRLLTTCLIVIVAFVQGCSSGSSSGGNAEVEIGFLGDPQYIYPASWQFSAITDLNITQYQWSFSDTAGTQSGAQVNHTFQNPGVHQISLQYTTDTGRISTVIREVQIGSGTVRGTISAAINTLVDVDTRDPAEPSGQNNDFDNAQSLSANANLAGVVDVNDTVDVYQVQLKQDQKIKLQLAEPNILGRADISVEVFRSSNLNNDLANIETNVAGKAEFIIPDDDTYFIRLTANSPTPGSHGIYSLVLEENVSSTDFALGEVLVLYKENRQYQAQGLRTKQDFGRIKTVSIADAQQFLAEKGMRVSQSLLADKRWQTLQITNLLNEQDDIEIAEPNWKRYPTAVPAINDPLFDQQWHYNDIKLQQAWQALDSSGESALGSNSVTVAVLDSGIIDHPDLDANRRDGFDFVQDDDDPTDPGDKAIGGQRSSFHGTHVAGTVAAINNTSGGTGVAPDVRLMPVRVLDTDGGFVSDIIQGVCYAAQISSSLCSNIPTTTRADIINMSLGSSSLSQIEEQVNNLAMDSGVIVIAASGNESTSAPFYPAAYDRVISVSATNRNGDLASYSNFGSTIDVAAPGGDFAVDPGVISTWGDDSGSSTISTFGTLQGTSMAAPHIAGVAALMKSADEELTHDEFRTMLVAGDLTTDIGSAGKDNSFGYGLIDAEKSVLAVITGGGPRIISSVGNLYFGVGQSSKSFTISDGGEDLGTVNVNENISWLSLDKSSGLGTYTATTSIAGLTEGNYFGEITVTSSNATDITISVELQVGNPDLPANAGVQYVLLQDENAQPVNGIYPTVAGSVPLVANQGVYNYQVTGLGKGRYFVVTGSDLDLDDVVCDAGESCGQYPTLNTRVAVEITEQQSEIEADMIVNYLDFGLDASSVEADHQGSQFSKIQKPANLKQAAQ